MEDLDFIIDTTATGNSELLQTFNSPFPTFSSSNFALGVDGESEDSEKSEDEVESDENEGEDDEYFGEILVYWNYL